MKAVRWSCFLVVIFSTRLKIWELLVFYYMALIVVMKLGLLSKTWLTNVVSEVLDHDIVLSGVC